MTDAESSLPASLRDLDLDLVFRNDRSAADKLDGDLRREQRDNNIYWAFTWQVKILIAINRMELL